MVLDGHEWSKLNITAHTKPYIVITGLNLLKLVNFCRVSASFVAKIKIADRPTPARPRGAFAPKNYSTVLPRLGDKP